MKGDTVKMKFSGRALVVEDNVINQIVLKAQLELMGFSVDIAENGRCSGVFYYIDTGDKGQGSGDYLIARAYTKYFQR